MKSKIKTADFKPIDPSPREQIMGLRDAAVHPRSADVEKQFIAALRERGLVLPQSGLIADGKIHRCDVLAKGDRGRADGCYCLFPGGRFPAGWFRNWTDGKKVTTWHYRSAQQQQPLSEAEKREIAAAVEAAHSQYEAAKAEVRVRARAKAKRLWSAAVEASAQHPYCKRKGVTPEGLKTLYNVLRIPIFDEDDNLQSLQSINADGQKLFLKGGRITGGHFWVAEPSSNDADDATICICEGWATGESIYQATGYAVVVAFCDWNLKPVAEYVRQKFPSARIVICADDDWQTEGNPGNKAAWEAARSVNGLVAVPRFKEADRKDTHTDFNDMAAALGAEAVKRAIDGAIGLLPEDSRREEDEAKLRKLAECQSASNRDPGSASKRDPPFLRFER